MAENGLAKPFVGACDSNDGIFCRPPPYGTIPTAAERGERSDGHGLRTFNIFRHSEKNACNPEIVVLQ